jgi:hypothetical protein
VYIVCIACMMCIVCIVSVFNAALLCCCYLQEVGRDPRSNLISAWRAPLQRASPQSLQLNIMYTVLSSPLSAHPLCYRIKCPHAKRLESCPANTKKRGQQPLRIPKQILQRSMPQSKCRQHVKNPNAAKRQAVMQSRCPLNKSLNNLIAELIVACPNVAISQMSAMLRRRSRGS